MSTISPRWIPRGQEVDCPLVHTPLKGCGRGQNPQAKQQLRRTTKRSTENQNQTFTVKEIADMLQKPVRSLVQFEGFYMPGVYDSYMRQDEDGDCLTRSLIREFRRSGEELAVRVHLWPDADLRVAVRVIRKIADWIESSQFACNADKKSPTVQPESDDIPF